jgi:hypothetical protein
MKKLFRKAKKFIFKKFLLSAVGKKYIKTPAEKIAIKPMKSNFLLVNFVFNNAELVELQYYSLKKFLKDNHDYLVADDSSDEDQAKATESFCFKNGISYIRLPKNNPGLDESLCHGLALNWVFYNVIRKIKPERFGFLEQDVFVISPGSFLSPWENESFWGVKAPSYEKRENLWRLWPGFCFFRRDFYTDKALNFLPRKYLDTGGRNFKFFKNVSDKHLIPWDEVKVKRVSDSKTGAAQFLRNIIHFVHSRGNDVASCEDLNKKKEVVYNAVFGRRHPADL